MKQIKFEEYLSAEFNKVVKKYTTDLSEDEIAKGIAKDGYFHVYVECENYLNREEIIHDISDYWTEIYLLKYDVDCFYFYLTFRKKKLVELAKKTTSEIIKENTINIDFDKINKGILKSEIKRNYSWSSEYAHVFGLCVKPICSEIIKFWEGNGYKCTIDNLFSEDTIIVEINITFIETKLTNKMLK